MFYKTKHKTFCKFFKLTANFVNSVTQSRSINFKQQGKNI